jgi:hypothetical protein
LNSSGVGVHSTADLRLRGEYARWCRLRFQSRVLISVYDLFDVGAISALKPLSILAIHVSPMWSTFPAKYVVSIYVTCPQKMQTSL